MTNAEKFKEIFKEFATEVWAFSEKDFLTWLNAEYKEPTTEEEYEYVYIGNGAYEKRPKVKSEPTTKNNLGVQMTNGEKMISAFPNGEVRKCEKGVVFSTGGWCHAYADEWWNAEYKEPTTKNDLRVDCIKKSDAINIIQDMHGLARADVISDAVNRIITMPTVTPQEPILDKLRAEIIELRSRQNVGVLECLDIIDKHKAEQEET